MERQVEWVSYQGQKMIVKRRFIYKGMAKIELFNPKTDQMFVVDAERL